MGKKLLIILMCFLVVLSSCPVAMGVTTEYNDSSGIITSKRVFWKGEDKYSLELEAYLKGEVESNPTDVVLVIDHSGSMWSAVSPEDGYLTFSQLDVSKAGREGYYVGFSKSEKNKACLIRYYNEKWQRSKYVKCTTYDGDKFLGFINTTFGGSRSWQDLSEDGKENHIFAVSISGSLYDALNIFMEEIKNAAGCRVAVTSFAGTVVDSSVGGKRVLALDKISDSALVPNADYNGSGIFVDGILKWDNTTGTYLSNQDYINAFEDPSTVEGQAVLNNTIDSINTDYGYTPTAMGLLHARRLFLQAGRGDADKVVVVFTDGLPTPPHLNTQTPETCNHEIDYYLDKLVASDYTTSGGVTNIIKNNKLTELNDDVNGCPYCDLIRGSNKDGSATYMTRSSYVDQAYQLKNSQGATVYSIGPTSGKASLSVLNNIATSSDYCYNASSDEIHKVFRDIAGVIVSSSQSISSDSKLKDEIASNFTLPKEIYDKIEGKSNTEKSEILKEFIKVYTEEYIGVDDNGNDLFGNRVIFDDAYIEVNDNIVEVSNFDYDDEAVFMAGGNPNGKKLIVEIPIVVSDINNGGVKQETNVEETSGIFSGLGTKVANFDLPHVDVPTDVSIKKVINGVENYENAFTFEVDYSEFNGYFPEDVVPSGNYLEADCNVISGELFIKDGEEEILEDVLVGSSLKIYEKPNSDYFLTGVQVNGEYVDFSVNEDGSYGIVIDEVTPNMEIIFYNNLTGNLVINKIIKGDSYNEASGDTVFIYKVVSKDNPDEVYYKTISFNESNTKPSEDGLIKSSSVVDLPAGDYTVEELEVLKHKGTITDISSGNIVSNNKGEFTISSDYVEVTATYENDSNWGLLSYCSGIINTLEGQVVL